MLRGGIFDQAGGGIARYATDEAWLVPHFEKMLYDNALLLSPSSARCTGSRRATSTRTRRAQTAAFLQRDLAAPGGGFYAALSADTGGVEGATYVWTYEQLAEVAHRRRARDRRARAGRDARGNWEGRNILTRAGGREEDPRPSTACSARILERSRGPAAAGRRHEGAHVVERPRGARPDRGGRRR